MKEQVKRYNPYLLGNMVSEAGGKYILASDYDALATEFEIIRSQQSAEMFLTLTGEIAALRAELESLAAMKEKGE